MDRIKEFVEKYCVISVVLGLFFIPLMLRLAMWIVKLFVAWVGNGINLLIKFFIKFVCERENREQIADMCNVTQFRAFNVVVFYLLLCLLFIMTFTILTLMIMCVIEYFRKCINRIDNIILGKKHQKSLKYKGIILWYIKCKADILFFLNWIKFDILKIRYSFGEDNSEIKWARRLSLENIVFTGKNVIKFFFSVTITHLILAGISIYTYYEKNILSMSERIKDVMAQSEITPSQFLEIFEVLAVLCLLAYILSGIRHKVNGYSDLHVERFKEIVQMEEKLLSILSRINYLLGENIKIIADYKYLILQTGACELSGKQCYIDNSKIEFMENQVGYWYLEHKMHWLSYLSDMKEEFDKLSELDNEFQKFSWTRENIYLVDHQTMLTKVVHFWNPGSDDKEYKRMVFFCKSSMEKWYKNVFIEPIKKSEVKYYSDSRIEKIILEESAMLDYRLQTAFEIELYLKKYERKIMKRFKKINKFSRFNLN